MISFRFLRCGAVFIAALALAVIVRAEPFPFVLPWDDATPGVTNLSVWLDKPAGAQGFVTARDGHLFAGKKRIRFFGVNVAFGGNFPTHADAEKVAARMAKFGINCVRFHHMDTSTAPDGLLLKDKRSFDPEMLDRLDYFIAELKKHGIYNNLNLHVGLEYPGFAKWEGGAGYFKGVDNFFPPMIEQQRDYARALLTHVNPFTGLAYAADPAVAFIEINNENGLMSEWGSGGLDAMPDPYAAALREQWNAWLTKKYGTHEKLAAAWNQGVEPLGEEMLKNGSFENAFADWSLETHEGAKATKELVTPPGLKIHVEQAGKESWHVQFNQSGLKVEAGRSYTISFRARASAPRKIDVMLGQAHAPWQVLAGQQVMLTPEWQQVRFTFSPQQTDDRARVSFTGLAAAAGDLSFEQISMRAGGIEAFREGEALGRIDIVRKPDLGGRTLAAQRDWNRFLFDTEAAYWTGMARFIKEDLKARSLVLGSAAGFSPWPVQAMLDVVDSHSYWQHPHFPRRPWDLDDWVLKNESMAGAPDGGALTTLAMRRVAGKPFLVTEYNSAAPNTYSSEAFLELCAVAGLQDWDGVFAFAYSHRRDDWGPGRITSFFDIDQHPTKMATLPAAVALFCRADVQPPAKASIAETTLDDAIEMIRTASPWHHASAYGIDPREIFQRPVATRLGAVAKSAAAPKTDSPVIESDNGELTWDTEKRRMLVRTPLSVALAGRVSSGETVDLGGVKITTGATMQDWATIAVTAMDGADFKAAKKILVTATGYAGNADMRWKDETKASVGRNWGSGPSVVEGIPATIVLPVPGKAKAWSLDGRGQRVAELPLKSAKENITLEIGPANKTLWYEIAVEP